MLGNRSTTELHPNPHQACDQPPYQGLGSWLSSLLAMKTNDLVAFPRSLGRRREHGLCRWTVRSFASPGTLRAPHPPHLPKSSIIEAGLRPDASPHAPVQLGNGSSEGGRALGDVITGGRGGNVKSDLVDSSLFLAAVRYGNPEGPGP